MGEVREHYNSTLLDMDGGLNPEPKVGEMVRNIYKHTQVGVVVKVLSRLKSNVLWAAYSNPWKQNFFDQKITLPGELNYISIDLKVVGNE